MPKISVHLPASPDPADFDGPEQARDIADSCAREANYAALVRYAKRHPAAIQQHRRIFAGAVAHAAVCDREAARALIELGVPLDVRSSDA
jgi:hypothetical protein